ncbi:MAG TPA: tetratricopeptide repeat protein [Acidobacteriaceae bacterium]|nr:tetratricopeptide repeat protein [Acidobacteriaceae bacterium]
MAGQCFSELRSFEKKIIDTHINSADTGPVTSELRPRRKIILRDSITLLVLILSTAALYALTSFLFRSFSARQAQLARQFAASGQQALSRGDAELAVGDLRTSLSYAPDNMTNRLLLAESLARSNHLEQARSYFLGLLDAQPADGFLNLQLARLARQRRDSRAAIDYYRAAAVGNWSGDSLRERYSVQLELAEYLIQLNDLPSARAELLIATADAPDDASVYTTLGERFEQAKDPTDALNLYRKAIKANPSHAEAPYRAGRVAYQMGDFSQAAALLSLARRDSAQEKTGEENTREIDDLLQSAKRIQELTLSSDLDPQERIEHLLRAFPVAKLRFDSCVAHFNGSPLPSDMQALQSSWNEADKIRLRRSSLQDPTEQDSLTKLIFSTEEITSRSCGAPSGDDALLLQLANSLQDPLRAEKR